MIVVMTVSAVILLLLLVKSRVFALRLFFLHVEISGEPNPELLPSALVVMVAQSFSPANARIVITFIEFHGCIGLPIVRLLDWLLL